MAANDRRVARAARLALEALSVIGRELRAARLSLGLSQTFVAAAAAVSRSRYSRIEAGRITTLSVSELFRVSGVLGLDPFVKVYPGGAPLRDGAHAEKLGRFLAHAQRPLVQRREVALPGVDGRLERRAWDADLRGGDERTTIELEMRLHNGQAQERRISLKRRDDPTDHFLLLVADTRTNRRVLREQPGVFADLPRLQPLQAVVALEAGRHPGTGLVLV